MRKVKTAFKKKHSVRHLLLGLFLCCICIISVFGVKICGLDAWHEFNPKRITGADETLLIYDRDGAEISSLFKKENRITVPLSDIPIIVQKAFISAEDARFYEHNGIDFIRIGGALVKDLQSGGYVQGASTITQQLIKLSHLSSEKTLQRKADEAILAYLMEKNYSKDEILGMYLNFVYFGGGFYGIEAASRGYFGISAKELSAAQGAMLAGILKSPTNYAPHLHYEASVRRQRTVLSLMHEYGYLDDAEYESAKSEHIEIKEKQPSERSYYIDYAITEACDILKIGTDELLCGGYRIYTAQDTSMQAECDRIFTDESFFPKEDVQAAIAVTDTDTGEICALSGGRGEYTQAGYNRATEIRRQPGSCIKPLLVYAPAMEYFGYTASSVLTDEPKSFGSYSPKNSGNKYYGNVTLRRAIKSSLNIPAVTVLDDIGVENGKSFAKKLGIEFEESDTSLSLALGGFTYGVSPMQMANAYGAICDGFYTEPSSVLCICDKAGNVIYQRNVKKERVLSDANAFILTDILCSVAEDGTGHRLSELDFDVACKTGTVAIDDERNRDAWIAAYTSRHSVAVWMGYDSTRDGTLPSSVTGGSYPALIVKELFSHIYDKDKPYFTKPDDVVSVTLDVKSTEDDCIPAQATYLTPREYTYTEYFRAGTEPKNTSTYWDLPIAPIDFLCIQCGGDYAFFSFTVNTEGAVYELVRTDGTDEQVLSEYSGSVGDIIICSDTEKPKKSVQYFIRPYKVMCDEKVYGAESVRVTLDAGG